MYVKRTLSITTDASGDGEATFATLPRAFRLIGVALPDDNFDDNYTVTLTDGDDRTLFAATLTAALDAVIAADGVDAAGAAVTDQSGGGPVGKSPLTATISDGGNVETGTVTVYLEV